MISGDVFSDRDDPARHLDAPHEQHVGTDRITPRINITLAHRRSVHPRNMALNTSIAFCLDVDRVPMNIVLAPVQWIQSLARGRAPLRLASCVHRRNSISLQIK